jgi:hypothetical protein
MDLERELSRYVCDAKYKDLPQAPIQTMKNVVLTVLGTTVGGATAEG